METYQNIPFRTIRVKDKIDKVSLSLCVLRYDKEALSLYTKWMNDHDNIKYLGRSGRSTTLEDEQNWLDRQKEKGNREVTFNIVVSDSGGEHLIGNCSLITPNDSIHNGIIGITIGNKEYRGQHYGRIALQLLLEFAFIEKNLHIVSLTVSEENEPAIKCYESIGFQKQGIHRDTFYYEGTYHNAIYMDITREEYERSRSSCNI